MPKIEITKTQKLYLLHLFNKRGENNITALARAFSCSSPNSKKILDNMVIEGFLYKDGNSYLLTKIGEGMAQELEDNRRAIEIFLREGLGLEVGMSQEKSYEFLADGLEEVRRSLVRKTQILDSFGPGGQIGPQDIVRNLGRGTYYGQLIIKNLEDEFDKSSLHLSMASQGFGNEVSLLIDEKSYIIIQARPIKKAQGGYMKTGLANRINYMEDGRVQKIEYREGSFRLPLDLLKYWNFLPGGILETSLRLGLESTIGIGSYHQRQALFSFIFNLSRIDSF